MAMVTIIIQADGIGLAVATSFRTQSVLPQMLLFINAMRPFEEFYLCVMKISTF